MNAASETSFREQGSMNDRSRPATVIGVAPGRFGATTTAGSGALDLQQSVCAVLADSDAGAQQLCAALCFIWRHCPNGATNDPINTMATAARLKTPLNMATAYHDGQALL